MAYSEGELAAVGVSLFEDGEELEDGQLRGG